MFGKQLYSKINSNYKEITPLTYIQNVIDKNSKNSLDQILKIYNHIYIEFENNSTTTRNKVPKELNGIIKLNKTFIEGAIKDINEYLPENTSPNFGDCQIIYNYKELHICKVQEDGTSVMFTIQTK